MHFLMILLSHAQAVFLSIGDSLVKGTIQTNQAHFLKEKDTFSLLHKFTQQTLIKGLLISVQS